MVLFGTLNPHAPNHGTLLWQENDEIQIVHSFGTCSSGYSQKNILLNKETPSLKKSNCTFSHDHGFVDFFSYTPISFQENSSCRKKKTANFGGVRKKKSLPHHIHHLPPSLLPPKPPIFGIFAAVLLAAVAGGFGRQHLQGRQLSWRWNGTWAPLA